MSFRDKILNENTHPDAGLARQTVTAFGHSLWMWELNGAQRDNFEAARIQMKGKQMNLNLKGSRAKLIILALREGGTDGAPRIFQDSDLDALNKKSAAELDRLYEIAAKLSGLSAADDEDPDAKKKSCPPGEDSSTASPATSAGPASPGGCETSAAGS